MVRLGKIYTKTGDAGRTGLSDNSRVSKTDARIEAIGAVDETNSAIGLAILAIKTPQILSELIRIQNELFDLGADISFPHTTKKLKITPLRILETQVRALEAGLDQLNENLPPLKSFVLPGGNEGGARLHLARAICRRAERAVVHLEEATTMNPAVLQYLNRLSDFLFVAARAENGQSGEVLWQPGQSQ